MEPPGLVQLEREVDLQIQRYNSAFVSSELSSPSINLNISNDDLDSQKDIINAQLERINRYVV